MNLSSRDICCPTVSRSSPVLPLSDKPVTIVVRPIGNPPPIASFKSSLGVGINLSVKRSLIIGSSIKPQTTSVAEALISSVTFLIFFNFSLIDNSAEEASSVFSTFFLAILYLL